jgi:hypothetical protein
MALDPGFPGLHHAGADSAGMTAEVVFFPGVAMHADCRFPPSTLQPVRTGMRGAVEDRGRNPGNPIS